MLRVGDQAVPQGGAKHTENHINESTLLNLPARKPKHACLGACIGPSTMLTNSTKPGKAPSRGMRAVENARHAAGVHGPC